MSVKADADPCVVVPLRILHGAVEGVQYVLHRQFRMSFMHSRQHIDFRIDTFR